LERLIKNRTFLILGLIACLLSCSTQRKYQVSYFDSLNQYNECKKIEYKINRQTRDSVELEIEISGIKSPNVAPFTSDGYSCIHVIDDEQAKSIEFLVIILPDGSDLLDNEKLKTNETWLPFNLKIRYSFRIGSTDNYVIKCGTVFRDISELKK